MAEGEPPYRTNRTRQDPEKWPDWGARFLEAYRKSRCVEDACEAIDIARSWVYKCREKYPEFAEAWDDLEQGTVDRIEASSVNLAIDGLVEPIFGEDDAEIGKKKKVFPGLQMFFLQSLRPKKYRAKKDDEEREDQRAIDIAKGIADLMHQVDGTVPTEPPPPAAGPA